MADGVFVYLVELHGDATRITSTAMSEIVTYGLMAYAGRHRDHELLGSISGEVVTELTHWELPETKDTTPQGGSPGGSRLGELAGRR